MDPLESPPPAGRVGQYRIERRLGSGGMGVVYLGHDDSSGTLAAVKLLRPEYAANPQLRARLRREVTAASRVPRFCTAPVLDSDVEADHPWVATEYVDGPTLDTALLERGRLTGAMLETFAIGVAVALRAIHQHGVVHRDLKPSNVLLTTLGPRVIDFGIAQIEGARTPITRTGALVGTPAYMAPEQVRGGPVTAAVDVFAWAGLVTYAATGHAPFGQGGLPLYGILHDEPELGDLAGPLRALVIAAFAKDPAARPSSAELVDRLSRLAPATTTQVLATAAAPPRPPARRRTRRRARVVIAAALVASLAAAGTAGAAALVGGEPTPGADEAHAAELASQSLAAAGSDQRQSMELALDAWAAAPTAAARGALLSAHTLPYAGQLGTEPGGTSVAVDPAGTLVAVGHLDGRVELWDAAEHRLVAGPLDGHQETVHRAAFSPDGTLLATASGELDEQGNQIGVRLWEVPSGRLARVLPAVFTVAWHPDRHRLLATLLRDDGAGGVLSMVAVFDPDTGAELTAFATGEPVLDLAVSPDGEWVAGGRGDGTAGVWRLADGAQVAELGGHQEPGVKVAFAPTGQLATVGAEGQIQLWDLPEAGEPRLLEDGVNRTVGRLLFTPDGYLLSGGAGSRVHWQDPDSDWLGGWLVGHGGTPLDVATSADGRLVAATGIDAPTVLWQRATYWLPHPDVVTGVAYHPAGDRLATAASDGTVRVWDTTTMAVTSTSEHPDQAYSVAYGPDGSLASTSTDGTVLVHHPAGRERAAMVVDGAREAHDAVYSPDGRLLAVAASPALHAAEPLGHRIYLWETTTLRRRGTLELGDGPLGGLAFSPDGSWLAAVTYRSRELSTEPSGGSELRVWRTSDLAEEPPVDLGPEQVVYLAIAPDGQTLATGGADQTVQLHRLDGSQATEPREIGAHPATIRQVAFSPDGRTLATVTAGDELVRLWDTATGTLVAALAGHDSALNEIAFSPDGRTLATAGTDGFVGLWPTDPGDAIARICQVLDTGELTEEPPHQLCA